MQDVMSACTCSVTQLSGMYKPALSNHSLFFSDRLCLLQAGASAQAPQSSSGRFRTGC